MCLLIAKPKGQVIPHAYMRTAAITNKHGGGFSYVQDGKLKLSKGFFDVDEMIAEYEKIDEKNTNVMMHFRMATHGAINKANCHPYNVAKKYKKIVSQEVVSDFLVAHNGIISMPNPTKDYSDTAQYIKEKLSAYPLHELKAEHFTKIEKEIGPRSKIAIMSVQGIEIVNEEKGERVDGVWYSNNGYLEKPAYTSYASTYTKYLPSWKKNDDDEEEKPKAKKHRWFNSPLEDEDDDSEVIAQVTPTPREPEETIEQITPEHEPQYHGPEFPLMEYISKERVYVPKDLYLMNDKEEFVEIKKGYRYTM